MLRRLFVNETRLEELQDQCALPFYRLAAEKNTGKAAVRLSLLASAEHFFPTYAESAAPESNCATAP
jgi:hypothetical protein